MHEENKNQNKFSRLVKLKLHIQQEMKILTSTVIVKGAIKFIITQIVLMSISVHKVHTINMCMTPYVYTCICGTDTCSWSRQTYQVICSCMQLQ